MSGVPAYSEMVAVRAELDAAIARVAAVYAALPDEIQRRVELRADEIERRIEYALDSGDAVAARQGIRDWLAHHVRLFREARG